MKLNETTLSFLEVDCIQQFGKEKGNLIFEQVEKIFQELLNNADYRNNAAIQNHLQAKLWSINFLRSHPTSLRLMLIPTNSIW